MEPQNLIFQKVKIDTDRIRKKLLTFQKPNNLKSIWQLTNSIVPFIAFWYISYLVLSYSFWAALPFILLTSGFLIRVFIIFHDCGHQTFFRTKKMNNFWGRITGVLTFTPFYIWSADHAKHHAHSGNLDKRGHGDIWMMTVNEYMTSSKRNKILYRLYRNPIVMFLLGPLLLTLVSHRFISFKAGRREKISIYGTNLSILIVTAVISFIVGIKNFLIIQLIILFVSHVVGVWLFYVQHQFEGVYWARNKEWDFVTASLVGGSYYKLPLLLRWFTGNIGYHHVHHLNSRIPNYNLPKCHRSIPDLQFVKPIKLFASLKSLKFRLFDEESGRLVGFKEAKKQKL